MIKFSKLKILFFCLVLFSGFLMWGNAMAAEYYVRADATGNNDGLDWTNAYTALPAILDRGENGSIYYIADGNYEGYYFNSTTAAVDGSKVITIKKATTSEHGTNTGWDNSYGNGQAVFKWSDNGGEMYGYKLLTFKIDTSYITIDGSVGSGDSMDDYGFKLVMADGFGGSAESQPDIEPWGGVMVGGVGERTMQLTTITLRHLAMHGPYATKIYDCFYGTTCSNSGISSYFKDGGLLTGFTVQDCLSSYWTNNINAMGVANLVVSGNYVSDDYCFDSDGDHNQNINLDSINSGIVSNNEFVRSQTFAIAFHQQGGQTSGVKIFNNIFYGENPILGNGTSSMSAFIGAMSGDSDTFTSGLEVHHNTIIGQNCGGSGFVYVSDLTNPLIVSYVYNNLLYDSENCRLNNPSRTQDVIAHDYNAYLSATNYTAETHGQVDTDALATDIFTDYANGDYSLKIGALPINNGKTDLGATYALDYAGTERDDSPDIGAYEYVGTSDVVAPAAPSGLTVQ